MPHREEKISSEELFKGKVVRLTLDKVRLENGREATREVVHHGGGAGIVALREDGKVALVRQFRYALGQELIELPAGKIEPGEPPRETALRELEEEVGCTAAHWMDFGSVIPTCGYCTEVIHLFLAWGLKTTCQRLDEDEFVTVFWADLDEAVGWVEDGTITDSKTVAGLLKAKRLQEKGELPG